MSVRGFNTGSGIERYDYDYLDNLPTIPSSKSDIGLDNVDNTSDMDKPVSTATQEALDDLQGDMTVALADKLDEDSVITTAQIDALFS